MVQDFTKTPQGNLRGDSPYVSWKFAEVLHNCISQISVENFERSWSNSVCIKANNFAKSANFETSWMFSFMYNKFKNIKA